jgi:hypothetical protein
VPAANLALRRQAAEECLDLDTTELARMPLAARQDEPTDPSV